MARSIQTADQAGPIGCAGGCGFDPGETDPAEARRAVRLWWGIGLGAVLAGNAMMFGLAVNTADPSAAARRALHLGLLAATLLVFALLGPLLFREAARQLMRRRLTVEALFLAGLTGALGASLFSMARGSGPIYFETVIVLLVVYAFGHQLTRLTQRRAARALQPWMLAPPECERLEPGGTLRVVPVAAIGVGDSVVIHPGRMIPVDGIIESGEAYVQEAQLTGEFFAVARAPGHSVFAGSYCVDGSLIVRASASGDRRRIDLLARAVDHARQTPSALQTEADRLTAWFLPLTLALALTTFGAWTFARGWAAGLFNALAVLLVACPCAIGFAVPISLWSALGGLTRRGLIPRRGDLIDALANIDTVVFDKTGTLTAAQPVLLDLVFTPDAGDESFTHEDLRRAVAAAERASDHPLAAAFHDLDRGAQSANSPAAWTVEAIRLLPGKGLAAQLAGPAGDRRRLLIGAESLLITPEQRTAGAALQARLAAPASARRVWILLDGEPVAAAAIDEKLLMVTPPALAALRELGLRLVLMTGDQADRARLAGFDAVHANLSPEAKEHLVRELCAQGRQVLFVGDGLNDALAMTASAAGLAVAGGSPLAAEAAGGVLLTPSHLELIPYAIRLCRHTRRTIRANLRLAVAYNAIGMALACAGFLHPVAAAVLMTCSSFIVTLRALRPLEDQDIESATDGMEKPDDGPRTGRPAGLPNLASPGSVPAP